MLDRQPDEAGPVGKVRVLLCWVRIGVNRLGESTGDDSGAEARFEHAADGLAPRCYKRGGRSDLYVFAHGSDYRGALRDYTSIAGKVPIPRRPATIEP